MSDIEVSRVINATPERVYELVSDLPRMGEWSPENNGGKWLGDVTTPTVGSKFKGKNANGWRKWSTIATVVAADPGKEFTFDVASTGMKVARWGYTLEAVEGGTKVTEHWTDHRAKLMAKITGLVVGVKDRVAHNNAGMEQTLERLAAAV